MPVLKQFTEDTLPDYYAYQIRDFIRIYWFDAYQFDLHAPVMPPEWQATFFVLVEEHALFSHATTVWRTASCAGQSYICGGLSGVFTYPAFQKRGYGLQVVQAATASQTADNFDIAILWTAEHQVKFYEKTGWEYDASFVTHKGDPNNPEKHDSFTMIRFLSEKAKTHRADFLNHPVYVGEGSW